MNKRMERKRRRRRTKTKTRRKKHKKHKHHKHHKSHKSEKKRSRSRSNERRRRTPTPPPLSSGKRRNFNSELHQLAQTLNQNRHAKENATSKTNRREKSPELTPEERDVRTVLCKKIFVSNY